MDEKEEFFRKAISEYCQKNGQFQLNPDKERVDLLVTGVLSNEKNYGLKYCPCRVRMGNFEQDLRLVCPCNFFSQKTWTDKGECWCSLFVKMK